MTSTLFRRRLAVWYVEGFAWAQKGFKLFFAGMASTKTGNMIYESICHFLYNRRGPLRSNVPVGEVTLTTWFSEERRANAKPGYKTNGSHTSVYIAMCFFSCLGSCAGCFLCMGCWYIRILLVFLGRCSYLEQTQASGTHDASTKPCLSLGTPSIV